MATDTNNTAQDKSSSSSSGDSLGLGGLVSQATDLVSALGEKAIGSVSGKVNDLVSKAGDAIGGGDGGAMEEAAKAGSEKLAEGESPVKAGMSGLMAGGKEKVKEAFGGGKSGGGGGGKKFSNIVETIEVGVPISVAYNQWTQFQDWSDFMKKVESVEQKSEEKLAFKGQVFLSHRTWESTITQQVPDEQIVWESTGEKGYLDGAVTFHELGPRLTRILIVVTYYPKGFFEKTANIWRAVGRRVRVEMKRYVRHVMTTTILDEDGVEGWRGEIRDKEVVRSHEEVVEEEQAAQEADDDEQYSDEATDPSDEADEYADEEAPAEEYDEELPAEEYDEEAPAEEYEEEAPADSEDDADVEPDVEPEEGDVEYEDEAPAEPEDSPEEEERS